MMRTQGSVSAGILSLLAAMALAAQEPGSSTPTAFVHVSVIPMDREHVLLDQTVVVRDHRIAALGPAKRVALPAGTYTIDGHGKFLLPGLGDMHAHVGSGDEAGLLLALANGIVTIRDMSTGQDLLALRTAQARGVLLPPRIYGVGRMGDCQQEPSLSLADCFAKWRAIGVDMLKLYHDYGSPQRLDTVLALAKQAHLRVGGHASPGPGVVQALKIPYKSIEHLQGYSTAVAGFSIWPEGGSWNAPPPDSAVWLQPGYRLDSAKLRALANTTRRVGTWNAPTLVAAETVQRVFEVEEKLPAQARALQRYREFLLQITKALRDAGAGLLLSEDLMGSPNAAGFALHRELELLVLAGLSPYEALQTGTRNVALYLGTQDSAGTVGVGRWADLVLLYANPLEDIRYSTAIAGVMAGGRWFSRADLDARMDRLEAKGCRLAALRQEASQRRGITSDNLEALMGSPPSCTK